jgi:hypothetical protein
MTPLKVELFVVSKPSIRLLHIIKFFPKFILGRDFSSSELIPSKPLRGGGHMRVWGTEIRGIF